MAHFQSFATAKWTEKEWNSKDLSDGSPNPFSDGKVLTDSTALARESFPFWLDREWIPAEQDYPEDDDTGVGLLCFNSNSATRALVYDCETKRFELQPSIKALKKSRT